MLSVELKVQDKQESIENAMLWNEKEVSSKWNDDDEADELRTVDIESAGGQLKTESSEMK